MPLRVEYSTEIRLQLGSLIQKSSSKGYMNNQPAEYYTQDKVDERFRTYALVNLAFDLERSIRLYIETRPIRAMKENGREMNLFRM
jgi:hypothetical protein